MATRAIIRFATREKGVTFNEHPEVDKILTQIYHHYDGYPEYLGVTLANYIRDIKVVNGLGGGDDKVANGLGCLAAQVVAELKDVPGNVYLVKPSKDKGLEDYIYYIWGVENKSIWFSIFDYDDNCIFVGEPNKLIDKYKLNTDD
jgi:hypothetical protein